MKTKIDSISEEINEKSFAYKGNRAIELPVLFTILIKSGLSKKVYKNERNNKKKRLINSLYGKINNLKGNIK